MDKDTGDTIDVRPPSSGGQYQVELVGPGESEFKSIGEPYDVFAEALEYAGLVRVLDAGVTIRKIRIVDRTSGEVVWQPYAVANKNAETSDTAGPATTPPQVARIKCEKQWDGGACSGELILRVIRTDVEADGTLTAVTDFWPRFIDAPDS